MKETQNAHKLLLDAMKSLPGDFSLREVRFHVNQALQKLRKVEENRAKAAATAAHKKNSQQTWNEMLQNGVQNPYTAGRTLDIINQMLEEENRKLNEILKRKEDAAKPKNPNQTQDEDDETLFG
jgi:hypothetical protein